MKKEQFTGQIPIQDGSEIDNDHEQLVAQVPILSLQGGERPAL